MIELRVLIVERGSYCLTELAAARGENQARMHLSACKPDKAEETVKKGGCNLVLLDLHDEANPAQFLSTLRTAFPFMPIVAVTADDEDTLVEQLLLNGASDCIGRDQIESGAASKVIRRAFVRSRYSNLQHYQERLELEHALRQFRLVFDAAPMFIWFKDLENRILLCNRSAAESIGLPVEQIEGHLTKEFYPQEADEYYSDDLDVIESGQPKLGIVEHLQIRDEKILVETSKIPYRDADGTIQGVIVLAVDITERLKLNQQREDFVATLAHDMKIPLIGANRMLDLFLNGSTGRIEKNQVDLLSRLRKNNDSLLELIRKLLEVYRYEQGNKSLYFERFSAKALLQQCVSEMKPHAEAHNLSLKFEWDGTESWVQADSVELRRLFVNLLDNAIKFTPSGGNVSLSLRSARNELRIEVRDSGIGIATEDQRKLFERFWQGEPGRKYPAGTGLGLYLSKRIVEAHKGRIWFKSEPGQGTTFSIALPVADGTLPATPKFRAGSLPLS